jgi:hypothetical protein
MPGNYEHSRSKKKTGSLQMGPKTQSDGFLENGCNDFD